MAQGRHRKTRWSAQTTGHISSRGEKKSPSSQTLCLPQVQSRILADIASHFPLHGPLATKKGLEATSLVLIIPKPLQGRERIRTMWDPAHKVVSLAPDLTENPGFLPCFYGVNPPSALLNLLTPEPDPARPGARGTRGISSCGDGASRGRDQPTPLHRGWHQS